MGLYSAAGIYVPHEFVSLFFRPHAHTRGKYFSAPFPFPPPILLLIIFSHDQTLKSGSLYKKSSRTKRWIKHWFILRNDILSWYQSSSDPYFPHGVVDLRYTISVEPLPDNDGKTFRIRTNAKTVVLQAESKASREEWVKSVRKVVFRGQNLGDSVKIIPYSTIIDVERSSAMDF